MIPEVCPCVVPVGSHDWLGCWGHHMKSPGFKAIREYQKVRSHFLLLLNHFLSVCVLPEPLPVLAEPLPVFVPVEPLPRLISDRQEGPVVEELVEDASSVRQARVWLLPSLLHPSSGHQAAP